MPHDQLPTLGGQFTFHSIKDFQTANLKANELGLMARITKVSPKDSNERDLTLIGTWVKKAPN